MSGIADRTLPGAIAQAYDIGEIIGHGATSVVYAATSRDGQAGALKVIHRQTAGKPPTAAWPLPSAATHLVRIFDRGISHGGQEVEFVFMERLTGGSLRERMRGGPLPLRLALRYARDLANGLTALHAAGYRHGDLKPENAIITSHGAVLIDLDLLDRADENASKIGAGTPTYMAPEQAVSAHLTPAIDCYALGCVLFEMLVGTPPFTGNGLELAVEHAVTPLPRRRLARYAPPDVIALVDALCAKQAHRRPRADQAATSLAGLIRQLTPRRPGRATAALLVGMATLGLGVQRVVLQTTTAAPQAALAKLRWHQVLPTRLMPPRQVMVGSDDLQLTMSAIAGELMLDISDTAGEPVALREIVVAVDGDDARPHIFTATQLRPGRWVVRLPSLTDGLAVSVYLPDRDASLRAYL